MKPGPIKVQDRKFSPPTRGEMKRSMEALIHHFKLYTEGYHVPGRRDLYGDGKPEGRVRGLSGRRRHQPAVSMQDPRDGVRLPASNGCDGKRHMLADVCAIIGSLDVVFGEIDR